VLSHHPDPARSNSVNFIESGVRLVAVAGIEIYDLVNVAELYNKEENKEKKGLYN